MRMMSLDEFKKLTPEQTNLILLGYCPFCEAQIKGFEYKGGFFAPEMNESLRENGIDPFTRHRLDCSHKEIKL